MLFDSSNKTTVYLFDGTSFAYRAYYAIRDLKTSKGFPTNAIYGFARMFLKLLKELNPRYTSVAFDISRKTFREKLSADYKANRKPTPDEFKMQLPHIKEFIKMLGISVVEKEGFEADDLLGTISEKLSREGIKVVIISPDKDIRQLINGNVDVLSISPQKKSETLYTSDNFKEKLGYESSQIPDIFGLAGDTSDNIPGVPGIGEKTATKLIKEFGSLENLYENLDKLPPKRKELLTKYKEQAFLSKELATIKKDVDIECDLNAFKLKNPDTKKLLEFLKEFEMKSLIKEIKNVFPAMDLNENQNIEKGKEVAFEKIKDEMKKKDLFSQNKTAVIIKNTQIVTATENKKFSIVSDSELNELLNLSDKIYISELKNFYHKTGKTTTHDKFFDISIGEYLINSLQKEYSLESILKKYLEIVEIEPLEELSHSVIKIGEKIENTLKKENLYKLYKEIEHPLIFILFFMERRGVLFDRDYMNTLKAKLTKRMEELEEKIYAIADETFNLNSPKQLSKILFEKLKIKPIKKTKSGYSTDVEVLTTLAINGYEIAEYILEYRKYAKLIGTFIDGIIKHMDENGRVHTTFIQTGTATGRLSSAEPNLQNLPVSDEISKQIRQAVISPKGYNLLWADYSQIELRVLAHLSKDEKLLEAYNLDKDIHTETAAILFGIKPENVTPKKRKIAKMVNFGIIYGMSPQGLSQRLGIPFYEAKEYIENYFLKFPTVEDFIEKTLKEAKEKGYVKTLFGRKRPVPELRSPNKNIRSFGERAAFNAVIQGTAADIMKIAMISLFNEFKEKDSYLTLQVHDEIVMEVPEEKTENISLQVKEIMENVVKLDIPLKVDINTGKRWE